MAIYHMNVQVIGRSAGRSATAAAAYRSGEKIVDERTGEIHDYRCKQQVDYKEIIVPLNAGEWASNRAKLWNTAEISENRKNSQVAREINVAIPVELNAEQGRNLVREYVKENFVNQGMIADICVHGEKSENPHAHIMLTMREADSEGLTNKNREWNNKEQLEKWREGWEKYCNKSLKKAGHNISVSHRSLADQGIEREATRHLGPKATQIEREGKQSDIGNINRYIKNKNRELEENKKALQGIDKKLIELSRENGAYKNTNKQTFSASEFLKNNQDQKRNEETKKSFSVSAFLKQKEEQEFVKNKLEGLTLNDAKDFAKNKPLKEVQFFIEKLQEDAQKKDLMNEAKNTEEYKEKEQLVSRTLQERDNSATVAANYARMKEETKDFFKGKERAEYAKREDAAKKQQYILEKKLVEEASKLRALKHHLTRPESDLAKRVHEHNRKAEISAHILDNVKEIYYERLVEHVKERRQLKEREGYER